MRGNVKRRGGERGLRQKRKETGNYQEVGAVGGGVVEVNFEIMG